jgi:hypothetical protein
MAASSNDIAAQSHNGRELELMLSGEKPFAIFSEWILAEEPSTIAVDFSEAVRKDLMVEKVIEERWTAAKEVQGVRRQGTRQFLYALRGQEWRIEAYLHLTGALERGPWNEQLEGILCRLLGYTEEETRAWIAHVKELRGGWGGVPLFLAFTSEDLIQVKKLGLKAIPIDFRGPKIFTGEGRLADFQLLAPDYGVTLLVLARIAVAGKFWESLPREIFNGSIIARFSGEQIEQINLNLRRPIEIMDAQSS